MGVEVNNIGYDSGSEAVTAVLGGFVDFCQQQPAETASTLESGDLKALAIMSTERHPSELLANVPTAKEQGVDLFGGPVARESPPPRACLPRRAPRGKPALPRLRRTPPSRPR